MMIKVKIGGKTETVMAISSVCPEYTCFNPENKGGYWICPRAECPKKPVRKVVRHG